MELSEEQKKKIEQEENFRQQVRAKTQRHGIPALISLFIPGLGQLIKGEIGRAIVIWVGGGILSIFIIPIPFIWVWQVYDAYTHNSSK